MSGFLSRRTVVSTMLTAPALVVPAAASDLKAAVRVLTAHPAAFSLASTLARNSAITVEAVQPAKLPATRLASYLSGRGKATLDAAAMDADAVITFRSFWPEDPLYPHARRSNIRIVEIDAGRPLDGALNGIAIAEPSDDSAVYAALGLSPMPATGEGSAPWLGPGNLGRMADVLAADLSRLDPASAKAIAANLAGLKQALLALKADADMALAEAEDLSAIAISPHFAYLAADLGIDLTASITAAPNEWIPERAARLADWLKSNGVAVVLLDAEPGPVLSVAFEGLKPVVLSTVGAEQADLLKVMTGNIEAIKAAFSG
jgi:hypothetical protein